MDRTFLRIRKKDTIKRITRHCKNNGPDSPWTVTGICEKQAMDETTFRTASGKSYFRTAKGQSS